MLTEFSKIVINATFKLVNLFNACATLQAIVAVDTDLVQWYNSKFKTWRLQTLSGALSAQSRYLIVLFVIATIANTSTELNQALVL